MIADRLRGIKRLPARQPGTPAQVRLVGVGEKVLVVNLPALAAEARQANRLDHRHAVQTATVADEENFRLLGQLLLLPPPAATQGQPVGANLDARRVDAQVVELQQDFRSHRAALHVRLHHPHHLRDAIRVQLRVVVEHHDQRRPHRRQADVVAAAEAQVLVVLDQLDLGEPLADNLRAAVAAGILDDNDLHVRIALLPQALQAGRQHLLALVVQADDGHPGGIAGRP